MEIIKGPDELNRLLENKLLSTVDDFAEVVKSAETVLPHNSAMRDACAEWAMEKAQRTFVAGNCTL